MSVFQAHTLEDVLSLPVSVLPILVMMAEDERRDFSYHIATAIISSKSEKGFGSLCDSRTKLLTEDPKKINKLRSEENMERARQIAEMLKKGEL
jgi:hypothetical protein